MRKAEQGTTRIEGPRFPVVEFLRLEAYGKLLFLADVDQFVCKIVR